MKCPTCGKEIEEGFAYCPWCGSNAAKTEDVAAFKRIAVEEKLKNLRHSEIAYGVAGAIAFIAALILFGFYTVLGWEAIANGPAKLTVVIIVGMVLLFVFGIGCLLLCVRRGKQRQDFVSKLEKGKLE